ncbi:MAG: DUF5652 family protein [Dehalococcoidia bacterium]|nr:DUF5652 family protein [Dehalococcoidia bacterium]
MVPTSFGPYELAGMVLLSLWSIVWKGIALWRAGRNSQLVWYIVMFTVNTAGILEIVYLFTSSRKSSSEA